MPGGEGLTPDQRFGIDKAIRTAETVSRYEFSVFVGTVEAGVSPRDFAERLHAALTAPDRSVLILVEPTARALEVVTGSVVRRDLDDPSVRLAAVTMQSAFAEGDLPGGIKRGLSMLAEQARKPRSLHTSQG